MKIDLRQETARRRGSGPGIRARLFLLVLLSLAQVQAAAAAIVNDAIALAHYGATTVSSPVVSASVPVSPFEADIQVTKTADSPTFSTEGQQVGYHITVTNIGTSTLSSVAVLDPTAASVDCPSGNPISTLAPAQSETCTATYTTTAADVTAGAHINIASVTALTDGGDAIGPVTAQATVTLDASATLGSVAGTVFLDGDSDGALSAGDTPRPGTTIRLLKDGVVVAVTTAGATGSYAFTGIAPGSGYTVVAVDPATGAIISGNGRFDVAPGANVTDIDLPIDPSGVVYDSVTRQPVAGARVAITDAAGVPLPAICLVAPAQQNQITPVDGTYRFDIVSGADPACPAAQTEYRIVVLPPSGYGAPPSASIPPDAGMLDATTCPVDAVPGGSCEVQVQDGAPSGGAATLYFLAFLLAAGDPHVVHNNIPLDPAAAGAVVLSKVADRRVAHRGDQIAYTIIAANSGGTVSPATIVDVMPAGFRFVAGSASADGSPVAPVVSGQRLTFGGMALPAGGSLTLTMRLAALTTVTPGRYVNTARIDGPDGQPLTASATATIEIVGEPVFDCSDIIGKVFDDLDRNGYADDGEPGLPGVRLATVKGVLITTDKAGRFHVACADIPQSQDGTNFILKLDTRTLPTGYSLTTENPRVVRLTAGKVVKMNFGAAIGRVVRLDLNAAAFEGDTDRLSDRWNGAIDTLLAALASERSTLRIIYHGEASEAALARKRLAAVAALVQKRWKSLPDHYRLEIATEFELRK